MPFPLAHPAAVLPFRRWSNHSLNFLALVIGAITPDLGYCLDRYDVDKLTHSVRGCFIFSLPVGWVWWMIFRSLSEPLVSLLPAPHRQALLPGCRRMDQPWFAVPLSLLIGAGTHVFWDLQKLRRVETRNGQVTASPKSYPCCASPTFTRGPSESCPPG